MAEKKVKQPVNPEHVSQKKGKQQPSLDPMVQKKMDKIVELQKGLNILRDRMTESKQDLVQYFEANPQMSRVKYTKDDYNVRFVNRRVTDGISQKLIIAGLSEYLKSKGITDRSTEIATIMNLIKSQRQTQIVSSIEIRKGKNSIETETETSGNGSDGGQGSSS